MTARYEPRIAPIPSPEEAAAIAAAPRAARARRASPPEPAAGMTRWKLAARREAHHATDGWLPGGWAGAARRGE